MRSVCAVQVQGSTTPTARRAPTPGRSRGLAKGPVPATKPKRPALAARRCGQGEGRNRFSASSPTTTGAFTSFIRGKETRSRHGLEGVEGCGGLAGVPA